MYQMLIFIEEFLNSLLDPVSTLYKLNTAYTIEFIS